MRSGQLGSLIGPRPRRVGGKEGGGERHVERMYSLAFPFSYSWMMVGFSLTLVASSFWVMDFPSAFLVSIRALDMAAPTDGLTVAGGLASSSRSRAAIRWWSGTVCGKKMSVRGNGQRLRWSLCDRGRVTSSCEQTGEGWAVPPCDLLDAPLEVESIATPARRAAFRAPSDLATAGRRALEPILARAHKEEGEG